MNYVHIYTFLFMEKHSQPHLPVNPCLLREVSKCHQQFIKLKFLQCFAASFKAILQDL